MCLRLRRSLGVEGNGDVGLRAFFIRNWKIVGHFGFVLREGVGRDGRKMLQSSKLFFPDFHDVVLEILVATHGSIVFQVLLRLQHLLHLYHCNKRHWHGQTHPAEILALYACRVTLRLENTRSLNSE
jgi:hypothetical protein